MPTPDSEGNLPYSEPAAAPAALQARTWKLTHEQYRRSILSFLGVEPPILDADGVSRLEPEVDSGVFRNLALSSFVSTALAEDYYSIAEEVAASLSEEQLVALIPCGSVEVACRDGFLQNTITRAFRRPATEDDLLRFGALFDLAQTHAGALADAAVGFRAVLEGLLTSPYFLYRTEIGSDLAQQEFELTDHEVASFLSYSILGSPPSSELLGAADRGELADVTSIATTVGRLLDTPEAEQQLREFLDEWMEIKGFMDTEEVRKDIPGFDEVRSAMMDEARSFLSTNGGFDGRLSDLLAAPVPAPGGALGQFYQSEPSASGANQARTGVLALGALVSVNAKEGATSPTLRGLFVRERLLCQGFEVPIDIPDISETLAREQPKTTRELYELHASSPACAGCHTLIDGIGMTFESLDAAGRFRSTQNGEAVNTTGKLLNTDVNRELQDHTELAQALAESEWVRECASRQVFRYYFGLATSAERGADGTLERESRGLPPIQAGRLALGQSGRVRDLIAAVLSSSSTLERTRLEPAAP